MDFQKLKKIFAALGCDRLYIKELAENDNSKQQVYFGPNFSALNIFPTAGVEPANSSKNAIFYAHLNYFWIDSTGNVQPAPHAKMILYPQYPEVRLSGFLLGAKGAPSELMTSRERGRYLFLAVSPKAKIFAFVTGAHSALAEEVRMTRIEGNSGLFLYLPLKMEDDGESRSRLIAELTRIHQLGWIDSKTLGSDGRVRAYNASNGGGYTLEAELGISPNGNSAPDYKGWEVKQHAVTSFTRFQTSTITLMTPEPTRGVYQDIKEFIRRYGYLDTRGISERLNFGGVYRANIRHSRTGLTLQLDGYDHEMEQITDSKGGIALKTDRGEIAAFWPFVGLMEHWNRKHAKAVYVPSQKREQPSRQYWYGNVIRLGIGTDFLRFLRSMNLGNVYYDPGIKMEHATTQERIKKRSQFRIKSGHLCDLYDKEEFVEL